ncbi:MAG TPA: hypothetical protein VJ770_04390 [Stellaceae bacterium]|nr:hypothetical protein [Stellaceae bacterium]
MSAPFRVLFALALVLLTAGCAASGAASNKDERHGFYGGISAGGTVP